MARPITNPLMSILRKSAPVAFFSFVAGERNLYQKELPLVTCSVQNRDFVPIGAVHNDPDVIQRQYFAPREEVLMMGGNKGAQNFFNSYLKGLDKEQIELDISERLKPIRTVFTVNENGPQAAYAVKSVLYCEPKEKQKKKTQSSSFLPWILSFFQKYPREFIVKQSIQMIYSENYVSEGVMDPNLKQEKPFFASLLEIIEKLNKKAIRTDINCNPKTYPYTESFEVSCGSINCTSEGARPGVNPLTLENTVCSLSRTVPVDDIDLSRITLVIQNNEYPKEHTKNMMERHSNRTNPSNRTNKAWKSKLESIPEERSSVLEL